MHQKHQNKTIKTTISQQYTTSFVFPFAKTSLVDRENHQTGSTVRHMSMHDWSQMSTNFRRLWITLKARLPRECCFRCTKGKYLLSKHWLFSSTTFYLVTRWQAHVHTHIPGTHITCLHYASPIAPRLVWTPGIYKMNNCRNRISPVIRESGRKCPVSIR